MPLGKRRKKEAIFCLLGILIVWINAELETKVLFWGRKFCKCANFLRPKQGTKTKCSKIRN
jgi:hypothetical protein